MSFTEQFARKIEIEHDTRDLRCRANNCPNNWSVSITHLCTAHAWVDALHWPRITQDQQNALTQRQNEKRFESAATKASPLTSMDKKRLLRGMMDLKPSADGRAWARKLKAREEAGEKLNLVQRKMWREALHELATSE